MWWTQHYPTFELPASRLPSGVSTAKGTQKNLQHLEQFDVRGYSCTLKIGSPFSGFVWRTVHARSAAVLWPTSCTFQVQLSVLMPAALAGNVALPFVPFRLCSSEHVHLLSSDSLDAWPYLLPRLPFICISVYILAYPPPESRPLANPATTHLFLSIIILSFCHCYTGETNWSLPWLSFLDVSSSCCVHQPRHPPRRHIPAVLAGVACDGRVV
jgi:hypothetical protein